MKSIIHRWWCVWHTYKYFSQIWVHLPSLFPSQCHSFLSPLKSTELNGCIRAQGSELVTECLDCCQHHGEHHSCGQSVNDDWVHVFAECRFDLSDRRRYWAREWREVFKLEILYDFSCPTNNSSVSCSGYFRISWKSHNYGHFQNSHIHIDR